VILSGAIGVYARGATEGQALAALEAKMKGLASYCSAALAEAGAGYNAQRLEQDKKTAGDLAKLLGIQLDGANKKDQGN
jgi:hypothetical protein